MTDESTNQPNSKQGELSKIFGPLNTSKYLGLPSMIGRNKIEIFGYLKDRLLEEN